MTNRVKDKKLVEQYSHYIESQNEAQKPSKPFSEELMAKLSPKKEESPVKADREARAGRRYQPSLMFARSRQITKTQAERLARYAPLIHSSARKYNVPVELICGVILQESGAQSNAVSHCGAKGLMQLMPGTARRFGVRNSLDPAQNIDGGTRYLAFLIDRYKGDMRLAVAAYNSGEHNVEKYGNRIPPFRETQAYVPAVFGYTQSMVNIFASTMPRTNLPSHAKRV